MMLTKKLDTVTAVTNVARYLLDNSPVRLNGTASDTVTLTAHALEVLSYECRVTDLRKGMRKDLRKDATLRRCVDAVAEVLNR